METVMETTTNFSGSIRRQGLTWKYSKSTIAFGMRATLLLKNNLDKILAKLSQIKSVALRKEVKMYLKVPLNQQVLYLNMI